MESFVQLTTQDSVATITLNRPEVRNALNQEVINQLLSHLNTVAADKHIRMVILRSTGKHFSAGADVTWMQNTIHASQEQNEQDAKLIANLMRTLNYLNKPTLCIVQGAAFGGAVGLVACCDMAIALSDAKFCLSEVKLGLAPAVISPYVIKAIGENAARHWMLTAQIFSAQDAFHINLVHKIVHDQIALENIVQQYSDNIKANGPRALQVTKSLIFEVANQELNSNIEEKTIKLIADLKVSAEGQEGLQAFLEKRSAKWDV